MIKRFHNYWMPPHFQPAGWSLRWKWQHYLVGAQHGQNFMTLEYP